MSAGGPTWRVVAHGNKAGEGIVDSTVDLGEVVGGRNGPYPFDFVVPQDPRAEVLVLHLSDGMQQAGRQVEVNPTCP